MPASHSRYKAYDRKPRRRFGKNEALFLAIIICLLGGAILGSVYVNLMPAQYFANISDQILQYFHSVVVMEIKSADIFLESVLKYGKVLIFIWILAFLPQASPLSLLLILYKGLGCGFTTAALLRIYGIDGLRMALLSFVPQNLLLIPAYVFVAYAGLSFMMASLQHPKYDNAPSKRHVKLSCKELLTASVRFEHRTLIEYGAVLLAGMACVCLAVLLELYVMPGLFRHIS